MNWVYLSFGLNPLHHSFVDMLFSEYFTPLLLDQIPVSTSARAYSRFIHINSGYDIDIDGIKIAIMGMEDGMGDAFRMEFYQMMSHIDAQDIMDVGNFHDRENMEHQKSICEVMHYFGDENILPVFFCRHPQFIYPVYDALEALQTRISVTSIDSDIDLRENENPSYLWNIITHRPNYLFNVCQIGYQSYLVEPETIQAMRSMYFDSHRLGWVNTHLEETEAILRSTHLLVVNMRAIRYSDNPAQSSPSANGLFGDEICRLMRYAGMSSQIQAIVFTGYEPEYDQQNIGARLMAQMMWYFHEGFHLRVQENPEESPADFFRYVVGLKENELTANFYKSKRTERWWMEVPSSLKQKESDIPHIIPCSYQDYLSAMEGEIPERWWNMYQKLF